MSPQRGGSQTTQLLETMLQDHQIKPNEIDLIAISSGPGSFTGLRIGCLIAKAWSFVHKTTLVAVPTHQLVAEQARYHLPPNTIIGVATDAQRKELFVSRWSLSQNRTTELSPISIVQSGELDQEHWLAMLGPEPA
ncbi:MAG: tRNA (adenosine(37)-N6)-threonylcarbamoyltransferase complex dimerization subunit type 1 TsaB [Pirellulaceae bacterium]